MLQEWFLLIIFGFTFNIDNKSLRINSVLNKLAYATAVRSSNVNVPLLFIRLPIDNAVFILHVRFKLPPLQLFVLSFVQQFSVYSSPDKRLILFNSVYNICNSLLFTNSHWMTVHDKRTYYEVWYNVFEYIIQCISSLLFNSLIE